MGGLWIPILLFAAGLALAALGGELFLRGVLAAAHRLRLSPVVAGGTLAAFATSGPELGVSVLSAAAGTPQLGLGDALGSNVVNLGLVLGAALALAGLRTAAPRGDGRLALLVAAPVFSSLLLLDGALSRLDAAALLAVFLVWLARELRARPRTLPREPSARERVDLAAGLAGLLLLFAAGELIVRSATSVASDHGLDPYLVGATIVAAGTSVPELATALAARVRGHHDLGLATLLGSNLFNGLFVVGVAGLIRPYGIDPREVGVALAAAALLALLLLPVRGAHLGRAQGVLLLAGYAAYVVTLAGLAG